jgi:hypothetical protein
LLRRRLPLLFLCLLHLLLLLQLLDSHSLLVLYRPCLKHDPDIRLWIDHG